MKNIPFCFVAWAASVSAQSLISVLAGTSSVSTLVSYVNQTGLLTTLGNTPNITILAPSNEAFSKLATTNIGRMVAGNSALLTAVLQYHVLHGVYPSTAIPQGAGAFVASLLSSATYENVTGGQVVNCVSNGTGVTLYSADKQPSQVTTANVKYTNGIIHIIDTVLIPPYNVSQTAMDTGEGALVGALQLANLVEIVDSAQDVTIFAPSNSAFADIGSAVGNLSTAQLTNILKYHVVAGSVLYSTTLVNGSSAVTLGGSNVTVTLESNGAVFVDGARVVVPNVLVGNGVVHVIDQVLNPSNTTARPTPSATAGLVAFAGASSVSNDPLTSSVTAGTTQPATSAAPSSGAATTPATSGAGTAVTTQPATSAVPSSGAATIPASSGAGTAATASPSASPATANGVAAPLIKGVVAAAALIGTGAAVMLI